MSSWADRVAMRGEACRRIEERMRESLARAYAGGPEAIDRRLAELDREWDVERAFVSWAPAPLGVGLALGAFVDKRFLVIPAVVAAFLALHAFHGFAPPILAMRRLGLRTREEIDQERYALKALRGDFRSSEGVDTVLAEVFE